jgi:diguanylate cyclase (GGDEF)-like protein
MSELFQRNDDALVFLDEHDDQHSGAQAQANWRILIVDDDPDVHSATMFALGNLEIQHRNLSFLHAYSAQEAKGILSNESDIAVILLDVVMEHEEAGLSLVNFVRNDLNLKDLRIILRTGQPGYAPEMDAIRDFDINDYKTKSELTRTKLFTAVTTAIRSYEQICSISANRRGLEMVIRASTELMAIKGLQNFSNAILQQINSLLDRKIEGFVCIPRQSKASPTDLGEHFIIAASAAYSSCIEYPVSKVPNVETLNFFKRSTEARHNLYERDKAILHFENIDHQNLSVCIESSSLISELDKRLLDVFCSNISVGLNNVMLASRLHRFAYFDPLTGLANRLKLLLNVQESLQSSNKENNVLSLIDIDHFAETNDALGHQFGDLLLCAVAQRLLERFGSSCHLARVGSDTFALFGDEKIVTPEIILDLFTQAFDVDNHKVQLSATIGLVKLDNYEGDSSDALKDTNIALKRAKTHQRSGYSYFTRSMGVEIRNRVHMMHELRIAIEQNHLFLVYQPQIDMRSGLAIGAEALIRWKTPDGQFIPPDQFIPIAEYSGLIVEIGEWVLRSACFELVRLRELGFTDFQMAVNVSQAQFSHPLFMSSLRRALQDSNAPAHCLELEITESMAMTDPEMLIKTLQQIKQLGAQISIDDFGTGFSSLSHLQKLNVDKLKIDRAFVNEITADNTEGSIAKMIVQLSQSLNIKIIAEGVETQEQASTLQTFGCHFAQGYFYAKPIQQQDFSNWLDNNRQAHKTKLLNH